tara:strand:+ start:81 stop:236 length:156 start_codon:yes stop_codon:yes gene_type:complete
MSYSKVFNGTHRMPSGKLMTGKKHSKASKPVKKKGGMKAKMARLRAMKKKK